MSWGHCIALGPAPAKETAAHHPTAAQRTDDLLAWVRLVDGADGGEVGVGQLPHQCTCTDMVGNAGHVQLLEWWSRAMFSDAPDCRSLPAHCCTQQPALSSLHSAANAHAPFAQVSFSAQPTHLWRHRSGPPGAAPARQSLRRCTWMRTQTCACVNTPSEEHHCALHSAAGSHAARAGYTTSLQVCSLPGTYHTNRPAAYLPQTMRRSEGSLGSHSARKGVRSAQVEHAWSQWNTVAVERRWNMHGRSCNTRTHASGEAVRSILHDIGHTCIARRTPR